MKPDADRQEGITIKRIEIGHIKRYEFFCRYVKQGDQVLNAGCGTGYASPMIQEAGGIVTSLDIHGPAIERGSDRYSSDYWAVGDLVDCPLGMYDSIVCFEVLEHIEKDRHVVERFHRHLLPGGVLVASVPNQDGAAFDPKRFKGHQYPHLRHYTEDEFRALLSVFGDVEILWQGVKKDVGKEPRGYKIVAVCR